MMAELLSDPPERVNDPIEMPDMTEPEPDSKFVWTVTHDDGRPRVFATKRIARWYLDMTMGQMRRIGKRPEQADVGLCEEKPVELWHVHKFGFWRLDRVVVI